jgi:hypothetical protein
MATHLLTPKETARVTSVPPIQSPLTSNAAARAGTTCNKCRHVARESTNPVTTLLAEDLIALA